MKVQLFRGAHAFCVLVKAFCLHELFYKDRVVLDRRIDGVKVRRRRMRRPARCKRALPNPAGRIEVVKVRNASTVQRFNAA
jgi:hypothetical protein